MTTLAERLASVLERAVSRPGGVGVVAELREARTGRRWRGRAGTAVPGGIAAPDMGRPAPVFSLAKPMLAAAVLRAAERGRLRLEDPIGGYLPDLPAAYLASGVTVRRVLAHTAGLPAGGELALVAGTQGDASPAPRPPGELGASLRTALRSQPPDAPGSAWRYSNLGYALIAVMLERVAGGTLEQALTSLVFAPAGLRVTRVVSTEAALLDLVPGWCRDPETGELLDARTILAPEHFGPGLVASTVTELLTFLEALLGGSLLSPRARTAMTNWRAVTTLPVPFERGAYGLGLMAEHAGPLAPLVGHSGTGPGWSAFAARSERGWAVAVITNSSTGVRADRIALALLAEAART